MKMTLIIQLTLDSGKTKEISISAPRSDVKATDINALVDKLEHTDFFHFSGAKVIGCKTAYLRKVETEAIV